MDRNSGSFVLVGSNEDLWRLRIVGKIYTNDGWWYRIEGAYDPQTAGSFLSDADLLLDTQYFGWVNQEGFGASVAQGAIPQVCETAAGLYNGTLEANLPIYREDGSLIGTPTVIPNPSPTMTPASDYSNDFPLPMVPPSANNPVRLTNCGSGGSEIILGRDANPRVLVPSNNGSFHYPLIVSANAEILLVDTTLRADAISLHATPIPRPNNAGLGN